MAIAQRCCTANPRSKHELEGRTLLTYSDLLLLGGPRGSSNAALQAQNRSLGLSRTQDKALLQKTAHAELQTSQHVN